MVTAVRLHTLDFVLPLELEARVPPEARGLRRDEVRLMVSHRTVGELAPHHAPPLPKGEEEELGDTPRPPAEEGCAPSALPACGPFQSDTHWPASNRVQACEVELERPGLAGSIDIEHATFSDLPRFLRPGDLLVVNDSATLPAATKARREDGSEIALHFSTQLGQNVWVVEPRRTQAWAGEMLRLAGGERVTLLQRHHGSPRLWVAGVSITGGVIAYLQRHGKPITYDYLDGAWPIEMYQTIFATKQGSVEMPSAGRPFSADVVAALERSGVRIAAITLHTGVASLEKDEAPCEEWCEVSPETADAIEATRANGGRVVAVGTTVVRTLESAADTSAHVRPFRGWTDRVITAERGVRAADGLLTGFHEPRATHLAMLEAIAGPEHVRMAYAAALEGRYLWHEFGDVHLIID